MKGCRETELFTQPTFPKKKQKERKRKAHIQARKEIDNRERGFMGKFECYGDACFLPHVIPMRLVQPNINKPSKVAFDLCWLVKPQRRSFTIKAVLSLHRNPFCTFNCHEAESEKVKVGENVISVRKC